MNRINRKSEAGFVLVESMSSLLFYLVIAQGEFHAIAAAAIIVLLVLLLTLNATAILLRNRFQRRY